MLNQMHEGLVVVSEKDKSLQFASKPAMKLLMKESKLDDSKSLSISKTFDSSYLLKNIFAPTRVSLTNIGAEQDEPQTPGYNNSFNQLPF